MMTKLDLGCGPSCKEGFIGVDCREYPGVSSIVDLRQVPWPWDDASVVEIWCSHCLEHLNGLERLIFMDQCYRVLSPNAPLTVIVPHWQSYRAYMDPTHQFPSFTERSMLYFDKRWRAARGIDGQYPITCNFSGWFTVIDTGTDGGRDIKFELFKV